VNSTMKRLSKTYLRPINLFAFLQILMICLIGCYKITFKIEDASKTVFSDGIVIGIPGFASAMQTQEERELYPPIDVSLAMDVFYIEWYATFGDAGNIVGDNLEHMFVEWTEAKRTFTSAFTVDGRLVTNGVANGLTYKKNHIWVCTKPNEKQPYAISNTSFVHELVHASLSALNGHGDADHEGKGTKGWTSKHTFFITKVNESLRKMKL